MVAQDQRRVQPAGPQPCQQPVNKGRRSLVSGKKKARLGLVCFGIALSTERCVSWWITRWVRFGDPRLRWLYRIEDGIPLMLANQAVAVPEQEHERLMRCARLGEVTAITAGQADVLAGD